MLRERVRSIVDTCEAVFPPMLIYVHTSDEVGNIIPSIALDQRMVSNLFTLTYVGKQNEKLRRYPS